MKFSHYYVSFIVVSTDYSWLESNSLWARFLLDDLLRRIPIRLLLSTKQQFNNKKAYLTQRSARDRRRLVNHNTIPGAEYSQNYVKIRTYSSSRSYKVDDFGTNRKLICQFLLVINSNFGPILHRFWDTATYWLKIAYFSYPSLIRRPRSLSSLWNCRVKLSVRKRESWGYSVVKVAWS